MKSKMLNLLKNANKFIGLLLVVCCQTACSKLQTKQIDFQAEEIEESIPEEVEKLMSAYPNQIIGFEDNHIIFADSTKLLFDDEKEKSFEELLDNPDIQDMFYYSYPKGTAEAPAKNQDPGRIRNTEFLEKMYGKTLVEVQKNLVPIVWCPKLINQPLQVTKTNDVDKHLLAVSDELDEHPEWKDYLKSAGIFSWRTVRGTTNRVGGHRFGFAIDLSVKYANYWQWDCRCTDENVDLTYKNKIPQGIIDIFEKHGFIWGGKWYHYDTMHFEYRPELLVSDTDIIIPDNQYSM